MQIWFTLIGKNPKSVERQRKIAFFCPKIWSYQKKAVLLQQQTYPASRKISALRVSLFYTFPRKVKGTFISVPVRNDRLYYVLCNIQYLLLKVNPNTTFPARLKALLAEFPDADINAMGFPKDWDKEPIWK